MCEPNLTLIGWKKEGKSFPINRNLAFGCHTPLREKVYTLKRGHNWAIGWTLVMDCEELEI